MPNNAATAAARLSTAPMMDGSDLLYNSVFLSDVVCSLCSCFDRTISRSPSWAFRSAGRAVSEEPGLRRGRGLSSVPR